MIELAGVPGCGKTAVCQALLERSGMVPSWVSSRRDRLRYSFTRKLYAPATLLRYRRLIRRLARCEGKLPLRFPRAVVLGRLLFWSRKRLRSTDDPLTSILFLLNVFGMERSLAVLEARLRRRALVMDEGYAQHALGVWLRSPENLRERIVRDYLAVVPRGAACIALVCDPEEALRRAGTRRRGVPKIMQKEAGADRGEQFAPRYAEIAALMGSQDLQRHFSWRQVEARGSSEEVADVVRDLLPMLPAVVFARN